MPIYILRPRETEVDRVLSTTTTRMDTSSRFRRIESILELRETDKTYLHLRDRLSQIASDGLARAAGGITGAQPYAHGPLDLDIARSVPPERYLPPREDATTYNLAQALSDLAQTVSDLVGSGGPGLASEAPRLRENQRPQEDPPAETAGGARQTMPPDDPELVTGGDHSSIIAEAPLTGTIIAEIDDVEAAQLQRELPEVMILRDVTIDLIPPVAHAAVSTVDPWHLAAIGLPTRRAVGEVGSGAGVTVAVLDTGVDATHPELAGKVTAAYTFDARPAIWREFPQYPSSDTHGHGTHVAGLICGNTVGVAPDARVVSGVMLPGGQGNLSDFVKALEWSMAQPEVKIINMSAGLFGYVANPVLMSTVSTIRQLGILAVFAIGNEGRNKTRSPGNYIEPLSVGASNRAGRVSGFSGGGTIIADNHQYTVPDLVAPGEQVTSSVIGGGYESWNGTSMAAPIVSGVAALLLEKMPDTEVVELEERLLESCIDLGAPIDRQGRGLIQVGTEVWN